VNTYGEGDEPRCVRFDVSNLIANRKSGARIQKSIVQDSPPLGGMFNVAKISAAQLIEDIKRVSGEGQSPISGLKVLGHGERLSRFLQERTSGGGRFGAAELVNKATVRHPDTQTYENAFKRIGPPRCWFAVDADVRLYGCKTSGAGNAWRSAFYRGTQTLGWTVATMRMDSSATQLRYIRTRQGRPDELLTGWLQTFEQVENEHEYFKFAH
jgi:hypothetical protein